MAKQIIQVGTIANDKTGDPLRSAFTKINQNFTELYDGMGASNTGDVTFDGVKVIGSGTASGDGNGYATLELVPDNSLYANAQYLVIDPTAPSHIHIRAGGPQDSSPADLFLGGEANYVRVNDNQGVRIQNTYTLDDYFYYNTGTDFTDATWFTESGNHFVQFTTTNAIMVSKFWDFTNGTPNQLIVYDGVDSYTLDYGGSGSNPSPNVYKVQVTQAPPVGITINALEFHIFTTTTNTLQLENNDFRLEVGDDIRMYARDVFRLYNYSTSQGIELITDWDNSEYTWLFGVDGKLQLPNGGVLGPEGMGWPGFSNGTSEAPVSIAYKTNTGNWQSAISFFGGNDTDGEGSVSLYTYNASTDNSYQWTLGSDGSLQLPINGSIKDSNNNYLTPKASTVAPLITNVLSGVVSDPPSNANWLNGTGVSGGVSNANISFTVTGGVPSFTINDPGLPGRYVGENIFIINGSVLGGTDGVDDMYINVSAITNTGSGVIDLTKQTHVLETGDYSLGDGYEGQVLHFVLKSGATNVFNSVWVQVANIRYINPNDATTSEFTSTWWAPFNKASDNYILNGVATAVFADGAWNLTGGILD